MKLRNFCLLLALIFVTITFYYIQNTKKKYKQKELALQATIISYEDKTSSYAVNLDKYKNFMHKIINAYDLELSHLSADNYLNAQKPALETEKVKFCIVTPSYNNFPYAIQTLNSVFGQNYHNWRMIYIDDASNDGMSELVAKIKQESNLPDEKFTLHRYPERLRSALYSFYYAAHNFCLDDEVMVNLDGDDLLATPNILNKLAEVYASGKTWITSSHFIDTSNGSIVGCNKDIFLGNWSNIRSLPWNTSHLRTYYTWLFKKIKPEDLQYQGKFITSAPDLALMYPMLEMAGSEKMECLSDVMYLYRVHKNNEGKIYVNEISDIEKHIRSTPAYKQLE